MFRPRDVISRVMVMFDTTEVMVRSFRSADRDRAEARQMVLAFTSDDRVATRAALFDLLWPAEPDR